MSRDLIQLLDEIESTWKNALSLCVCEQPDLAAAEVAKAERLLHELAHQPKDIQQAPTLRARFDKLHRLHQELVKQACAGKVRVEQQLAAAKKGSKTLKAYSSGQTTGRLNKVI